MQPPDCILCTPVLNESVDLQRWPQREPTAVWCDSGKCKPQSGHSWSIWLFSSMLPKGTNRVFLTKGSTALAECRRLNSWDPVKRGLLYVCRSLYLWGSLVRNSWQGSVLNYADVALCDGGRNSLPMPWMWVWWSAMLVQLVLRPETPSCSPSRVNSILSSTAVEGFSLKELMNPLSFCLAWFSGHRITSPEWCMSGWYKLNQLCRVATMKVKKQPGKSPWAPWKEKERKIQQSVSSIVLIFYDVGGKSSFSLVSNSNYQAENKHICVMAFSRRKQPGLSISP